MIQLENNKDLTGLSTMGCTANARWFYELTDASRLPELAHKVSQLGTTLRILGSGSNVVFTPNIDAVVVQTKLKGIKVVEENDEHIWLQVEGGENWHEFVHWSVVQGYSGIENLALIPGTVGAAPVQNIGAYGVEICRVLEQVTAYDIKSDQFVHFANHECQFSYRDSLFKENEGRYVITSVLIKLNKHLSAELSYGPLKPLAKLPNLNAQHIFESVIQIRTEKLPDPSIIPNAGSFFKNPIITSQAFSELKATHPNIVNYPAGEHVKLAAGWLIDQVGLKGASSKAGVGCYSNQALVIVNPNKASGDAVLEWADVVMRRVKESFGVVLEMEPRVWL